MEQEKKLRFHMKLRLYYEERNFGPGVAGLMQLVRERGSLAAACQEMHMAYSKAWRIIHEAEEGFGFRLLDSTIGGRHGGGASLTPEAEQLLADYRRFETDIFAYSQARFQEIFPQSKP